MRIFIFIINNILNFYFYISRVDLVPSDCDLLRIHRQNFVCNKLMIRKRSLFPLLIMYTIGIEVGFEKTIF